MTKGLRRLPIACLFTLATAGLAHGTTLLSITGPIASGAGLGMTNFNSAQSAIGESFALSVGFTNISMVVNLDVFPDDPPVPVTAWLTNRIGNGTTAANVLATTTGTPTVSGNYTAFSGLSLGPGTYFLVLAAVHQINDTGWNWSETPTIVTAPGITFRGQFSNPGNTNDSWNNLPPAYRDFTALTTDNAYLLQITGTAVPEPNTIALAGFGIILVLGRFRRTRPDLR